MAFLALDTSGLSRLLDGDERAFRALEKSESREYIVPLAADAELRFGFCLGSREGENITKYTNLMKRFNITVVCPDQSTSIIYAELATWARTHGVALSFNDLWIAATAVQNAAELLTFDNDFCRLPQVRLARSV